MMKPSTMTDKLHSERRDGDQRSERVAEKFILRAVQDWGQSDADRVKAVQDVLDAAGFKATATCGPVFGRIWPKPCEGPDGALASGWLAVLTDTMARGRFEAEAEHVRAAIAARSGTMTAQTDQASGTGA